MSADLSLLERSEHLVLFGFRLTALGHSECPALRGLFCGLLGVDADEGLGALLTFVRMLGWEERRRVRLHAPGCAAVSEDEAQVVAAVAAAQASLFGADESDLRGRLEVLLGREPCGACIRAAQGLAATLACHGVHLPQRPLVPTLAARATLH